VFSVGEGADSDVLSAGAGTDAGAAVASSEGTGVFSGAEFAASAPCAAFSSNPELFETISAALSQGRVSTFSNYILHFLSRKQPSAVL
jgi:hypothetical protein